MQVSAILIGAMLFVTGPRTAAAAGPAAGPRGSIELKDCTLHVTEEVEISAQEAGQLEEVFVKEGEPVTKGQKLAQIDDERAKMQLRAAEAKRAVAEKEATNDIPIQYAKAAMDTAEAEYYKNQEANRKMPGTVTDVEMRRLLLKYWEMHWSKKKAEMDKEIAGLQQKVAEAEVDAAKETIERHKIISPFDGKLEKLHHHVGEWVQPSNVPDPVMHLVRLDNLWVKGTLQISECDCSEVEGRPVEVTIHLAHNKVVKLPGKVVFVSAIVSVGGQYEVRAEVQNRQENGHWLLSAGMPAEMTIQLR